MLVPPRNWHLLRSAARRLFSAQPSAASLSPEPRSPSLIRNTAIIAHVDVSYLLSLVALPAQKHVLRLHILTIPFPPICPPRPPQHGKSTLCDKILRDCSIQVSADRMMDSGVLERERGITITSKVTTVEHNDYLLNVVDSPGHSE